MAAEDADQETSKPIQSWAKIASGSAPQKEKKEEAQDPEPRVAPTDKNQSPISALQSQVEDLIKQLEKERQRTCDCAAERDDLRSRAYQLEAHLENSRKKLLSLQPPQDVSDEDVKLAFEDLCHNIEDWIDVNCETAMNLDRILPSKHWSNDRMTPAERHIVNEDIQLSMQYPNVGVNVIMNAIFSLVYESCLNEKRWFTGAKEKDIFLNEITDAMALSRLSNTTASGKGQPLGHTFSTNLHLRRWRSETFRAIRRSDAWAERRTKLLRMTTAELFSLLEQFMDKKRSINAERLQEQIVEPAYKLAEMIKLSLNGYNLDFVISTEKFGTWSEVGALAAKHKLVDATTGSEVIFNRNTRIRIKRLRLCVFPSLEKTDDEVRKVCLSKGLVVFERLSHDTTSRESSQLSDQ